MQVSVNIVVQNQLGALNWFVLSYFQAACFDKKLYYNGGGICRVTPALCAILVPATARSTVLLQSRQSAHGCTFKGMYDIGTI